ncbi:MAG: o-succinylbenzoate synthase [Steroidobacteraceae bacterium]
MILLSARASAVTLRFARPLRTAQGVFAERQSVILELRDGDGVAGYGEAAPWPGFGTETAGASLDVLQRACELLRGADLEPAEWTTNFAMHFAATPAARGALDGALWDLAARRSHRPLAIHLAERRGVPGAASLQRVSVSALLLESEPDALRLEARRARDAGHRAAKLKLGSPLLAEDVARARAAREGLGSQVALRGDANGAWTEREALEALAALAPFDFAYVEQPLPADAFEALARLRRASPVRIAADESAAAESAAALVIDSGAVDVVVLKPGLLGGPARALGMAARARRAGCEVVFTHAFESAVGARHALHCAAAWGDAAAVHGLVTEGLFLNDIGAAVGCSSGTAWISGAPGIGVLS